MSMLAGLTQRVDVVPSRGERRDALDQAWTRLLEPIGWFPVPLSNCVTDPDRYLDALSLDALILTGGNDLAPPQGEGDAPERDAMEHALLAACARRRLPVLGVCRGFQIMNVHLDGRLVPVKGHVGGEHALQSQNGTMTAIVNSFHSFGICPDDVGRGLEPLIWAEDGTIEAARHIDYPWLGIMWHPERRLPRPERQRRLIRLALQGRIDVPLL